MTLKFKYNYHLDRLQRILNFDADSAAPKSSFLFLDALSYLSMLSAVISTPVILWSLFRLKKYGWLIAFCCVTIGPYFIIRFLTQGTPWLAVLHLIPLAFLIGYYVILKHAINDWREPIFTQTSDTDFNTVR